MSSTPDGRAALASNYTVTGGIQTGVVRQPTLLPFAEQQQQALRDAFITDGNLTQLTDGLGTTLAAAYQARAHYLDRERFTSISKTVEDGDRLCQFDIGSDSNAGKYFFANGTTDGKKPVSDEAMAIFKAVARRARSFWPQLWRTGRNSRRRSLSGIPARFRPSPQPADRGAGLFQCSASSDVYNRGPIMNLIDSPSFPSGHTTYGYMGSVLLAMLVPDRYQEMVARGAEYGNDRIIMGAHYAMDVLGGEPWRSTISPICSPTIPPT